MPKNLWCPFRKCERSKTSAPDNPFLNFGARGSHLRRCHGLASIATRIRRPEGGELWCDVDGCTETKAYLTAGGLGGHKRTKHGIVSEKPDTRKRRDRRVRSVPAPGKKPARTPRLPAPDLDPIPAIVGIPRYIPRRPRDPDTGDRERVRRRVQYCLTQTWAAEFDLSPEALRETVLAVIAENFAEPLHVRRRITPIDAYAGSVDNRGVQVNVAPARGARSA